MTQELKNNWRSDPGLTSTIIYKKKFALYPVKCHDGTQVWLDHYYTKYQYWGFRGAVSISDIDNIKHNLHEDKLENISEAEYIVRKLTEGC
jgi:hypothetical protein